MVAVTYGSARVTATDAARADKSAGKTAGKSDRANAAAPRKGWFARLIDAMAEARLQQARREIRMHTQWLPFTFDENGNRVPKTGADDRFGW